MPLIDSARIRMANASKPVELTTQLNKLRISVRNKRILDVGCGKGDWISYINSSGVEVRALVGLDISLKEVTLAKSRNSVRNVEFLRATIDKLPFKENAFDIIICNVVLPYVTKRKHARAELSQVLDEEGIMFVSHHGFGWYLASALLGHGVKPWASLAMSFLFLYYAIRIISQSALKKLPFSWGIFLGIHHLVQCKLCQISKKGGGNFTLKSSQGK